jgi:hypothetical protein
MIHLPSVAECAWAMIYGWTARLLSRDEWSSHAAVCAERDYRNGIAGLFPEC